MFRSTVVVATPPGSEFAPAGGNSLRDPPHIRSCPRGRTGAQNAGTVASGSVRPGSPSASDTALVSKPTVQVLEGP
jgi:hypothetical protein